MEFIIEQHNLEIVSKDKGRYGLKLIPIGISSEKLSLEKEGRKIYIIHHEEQIFYVGETGTSIKKRLERGFKAYNDFIKNGKTKNGYKGYKWIAEKNSIRKLTVSVAIFGDVEREIIEAIEGELVYLVRAKTEKWPEFQNEIHFRNNENTKETAESILKKAFEGGLISHAK